MTDKEVLQKAIEIAMENGMSHYYNWMLSVLKDWLGDIENGCIGSYEEQFHINEIIFSHDFAKAFFPKEIAKMVWYIDDLTPYSFEDCESWKVHLMKMVLEENPIDYLRKFINEQSESA